MAHKGSNGHEVPPTSSDYEVGYGKPPVAWRFKPGQSGNPSGRPKGACNKRPPPNGERLKQIILEEAYRDIKVNKGQRQIRMSLIQAVIRSIAVNAAKGKHRAQRLFTTLVTETERADRALHEGLLEAAINYKRSWMDRLWRREKFGEIGPEPIPHPDDVLIDVRAGTVSYKGPITPEEKKEWDRLRERFEMCDPKLEELKSKLKETTTESERADVVLGIARTKLARQKIGNMLGINDERAAEFELTEEEKEADEADKEWLRSRYWSSQRAIQSYKAELKKTNDKGYRQYLVEQIAREERLSAKLKPTSKLAQASGIWEISDKAKSRPRSED